MKLDEKKTRQARARVASQRRDDVFYERTDGRTDVPLLSLSEHRRGSRVIVSASRLPNDVSKKDDVDGCRQRCECRRDVGCRRQGCRVDRPEGSGGLDEEEPDQGLILRPGDPAHRRGNRSTTGADRPVSLGPSGQRKGTFYAAPVTTTDETTRCVKVVYREHLDGSLHVLTRWLFCFCISPFAAERPLRRRLG